MICKSLNWKSQSCARRFKLQLVSSLAITQIAFCLSLAAQVPVVPELDYESGKCKQGDQVIDRKEYHEKLKGFWLGQCIANWTGLRTEGVRNEAPFYTDYSWGTNHGRDKQNIEFVLVEGSNPWGADDDTDIEYIYQSILYENNVSILTPEMIRDGWLKHIKKEEENYLWVSNQRAFNLMMDGMLPPETSLPENNQDYDQIDAQLTTEIFGLFAPCRPDIALQMAHLPIRTAACRESEWISEFYIIMHSLASSVDSELTLHYQTVWLAEQARQRLPNESFPAKIYDFVKVQYENNPDKNNWEKTRDALYNRYQVKGADGYKFRTWFDAGINYGASLISLFYGEGDYKRTVQIGSLCGWDSDNPTATWGGLLGFMMGQKGLEEVFPEHDLSGLYKISRTRINFSDRTPDLAGEDTFELMANRGIHIIDRVVHEKMEGRINLEKDVWCISGKNISLPIFTQNTSKILK